MTLRTFTFALLVAGAPSALVQPTRAQSDLPAAFNGEDLRGWVVPEGNIWWRAGDGMLRARSGPEQQGSILWTDREYENFAMELEFRMGEGTVDSGIFLRDISQQIQIGISGSLQRDMTASPYIAGKGYPVEAEGVADLLKAGDWNAMTIVAIGADYTVWLNGRRVMSYTSDTAVDRGPIGLQVHANRDMAIDFRDIRIGRLK